MSGRRTPPRQQPEQPYVVDQIVLTVIDNEGGEWVHEAAHWDLTEGLLTIVLATTTDTFLHQIIYPAGSFIRLDVDVERHAIEEGDGS